MATSLMAHLPTLALPLHRATVCSAGDLDAVRATWFAATQKIWNTSKSWKNFTSRDKRRLVHQVAQHAQTDEHDYEFKKKHAIKFLQDGAKLKAFVFFKGRSIIFKEQGQILLLKLAQELEEYGKVEQLPKLEGKRMIMFIAPKKIK